MADYTYRDGIDGKVPVGSPQTDGCCPPDLCSIDPDSIACAMVGLLPSGPLWDKSKELAIACNGRCDQNCETFGNEQDMCASLVLHAIYSARKLHYYIQSALWPSIREADPLTAWDTMDSWLDRLGWVDCYNTFCRDKALGDITPYEVIGECGVTYCPPIFGEDLSRLYKRGVITALRRMRLGFIPNLSTLNFILEPLHSELVLDPSYRPGIDDKPCLVLRPRSDYASKIIKDPCPRGPATILEQQKQVKLYLTPADGLCVGGPRKAYPLTLAAHCIVMSLLPNCCNVCLKRQP